MGWFRWICLEERSLGYEPLAFRQVVYALQVLKSAAIEPSFTQISLWLLSEYRGAIALCKGTKPPATGAVDHCKGSAHLSLAIIHR